MPRLLHCGLFGSLLLTLASSAFACDLSDGSRKQTALLLVGQHQLVRWQATSPEIQQVELPNGLHLGVLIEDASAEKYRQLHQQLTFVPETVHVTLYDMAQSPPRVLTDNWAGANSLQMYRPQDGEPSVFGQTDITLFLEKPLCARS